MSGGKDLQSKTKDIEFMSSERLVDYKEIYKGRILSLYKAQMQWDNQRLVDREIVHHQPAVAILAVNDQNQVILVKQYRPAVDAYLFELPAGIIDYLEDGELEAPYLAAKRELEEETAYQAEAIKQVMSFYPSPGCFDEMVYLFQASTLNRVDNPLPMDEDESIDLAFFDKEAIQSLMEDGQVIDAKTIIGLQYWLNQKD